MLPEAPESTRQAYALSGCRVNACFCCDQPVNPELKRKGIIF